MGVVGRPTTLNGAELRTRPCPDVKLAYLYATTPHMFEGGGGPGRGTVLEYGSLVAYVLCVSAGGWLYASTPHMFEGGEGNVGWGG